MTIDAASTVISNRHVQRVNGANPESSMDVLRHRDDPRSASLLELGAANSTADTTFSRPRRPGPLQLDPRRQDVWAGRFPPSTTTRLISAISRLETKPHRPVMPGTLPEARSQSSSAVSTLPT